MKTGAGRPRTNWRLGGKSAKLEADWSAEFPRGIRFMVPRRHIQLKERLFRIPCSPPWRAVREQARLGGLYYWLQPMPINESKPPHEVG